MGFEQPPQASAEEEMEPIEVDAGESESESESEVETEADPTVESEEKALPSEKQVEIVFDLALKNLEMGGAMDGNDFSEKVLELAELLKKESPNFDNAGKEQLEEVCARVQPHLNGTKIEFLEEGLGGQWDGTEIKISPELLLRIAHGDQSDVTYLQSTRAHEDYHKENEHVAEYKAGGRGRGKTMVKIGGMNFTLEELIEGLTVLDEPEPGESEEYLGYAEKILNAIKKSKKVDSLDQVRTAVNEKKDFRAIDDQPVG